MSREDYCTGNPRWQTSANALEFESQERRTKDRAMAEQGDGLATSIVCMDVCVYGERIRGRRACTWLAEEEELLRPFGCLLACVCVRAVEFAKQARVASQPAN